jgi:hypothetical protein
MRMRNFLVLAALSLSACVDFDPDVGREIPPLPPCAPAPKATDAGSKAKDAAIWEPKDAACSVEAGIAAYGPSGY